LTDTTAGTAPVEGATQTATTPTTGAVGLGGG
jgi:hypothetical protein